MQHALDLRTGQEVAIKFIHRGPGAAAFDERHILRELQNHRLAGRHPNIVELHEASALFRTGEVLGFLSCSPTKVGKNLKAFKSGPIRTRWDFFWTDGVPSCAQLAGHQRW